MITKIMSRWFPDLKEKLIQAQLDDTPQQFIKKILTFSLMISFSFSFFFLLPILDSFGKSLIIILPTFLIIFLLVFSYLKKLPDLYISKIQKQITKELIFALRFLIIELDSGIMLEKAFHTISKNYPVIGRYFREIVDKVNYGTDLEKAINETVDICPAENLRAVLVQLQNSMKTGADVVSSLATITDQFTREQHIAVNEYSKKLNPVAMFYMIIAVIFPSIGFMMLIIITSFIGFQIDKTFLFIMVVLLSMMQFMFIAMVKSIRPAVDF